MMKSNIFRKTVFLFILLYSFFPVIASGEITGKIIKVSSTVKIDAFGKDCYVDAIPGDILYKESVLYFPVNSKAVILLKNNVIKITATSTIPIIVQYKENPGTHFSQQYITISNLLTLIPDNSEYLGTLFTSIWTMLHEITWNLFDNKSSKKYRTKEDQPESGFNSIFGIESYELKKAGDQLKRQDYSGALSSLNSIRNPTEGELPIGGLEFLKGLCYLKLSEYAKADEYFSQSLNHITHSEKDNPLSFLYPSLLYTIGVLSITTGDYSRAATFLGLYIEYSHQENEEITIYVYSLFINSCIESGNFKKAEELLKKTISETTNNQLREELAVLSDILYFNEENF